MKHCPYCGKQNSDDARFCQNCAQAFPIQNHHSISCPRCYADNRIDNKFCHKCGLLFRQENLVASALPSGNLVAKSIPTKYWIIGGVGCLALFILMGIAANVQDKRRQQTKEVAIQQTPTQIASTPVIKSYASDLAQAQTIIKKPDATLNELKEARASLQAIPLSAKEYNEAQKLFASSQKKYVETEKKVDAEVKEGMKLIRQSVIKEMEQKMLAQGMDFYFSAEGKNADILRVKYVLMSRPLVYKITTETEFLENMKKTGVKKVIFTDGYDDSWTYDL